MREEDQWFHQYPGQCCSTDCLTRHSGHHVANNLTHEQCGSLADQHNATTQYLHDVIQLRDGRIEELELERSRVNKALSWFRSVAMDLQYLRDGDVEISGWDEHQTSVIDNLWEKLDQMSDVVAEMRYGG